MAMTEPADELLDGLRALGARLGPSRALRVLRRRGGLETMESRSAGAFADEQMIARHEYLTAQRGGGDPDRARRHRELELLRLQVP